MKSHDIVHLVWLLVVSAETLVWAGLQESLGLMESGKASIVDEFHEPAGTLYR